MTVDMPLYHGACSGVQIPRISFHRESTSTKILLKTNSPIIANIVALIYAIASCVSIIDPGNTSKKTSIAYFTRKL